MKHIALGTSVKFTELAYVVRRGPDPRDTEWGTPVKGNYQTISMKTFPDDTTEGRFLGETEGTNKNVLAIPHEGSGIVIGLERKLIGKSVAGGMTSGAGGFEPDYDPGYFCQKGSPVDLFVVKSELRGKPFYVPSESLEVLS